MLVVAKLADPRFPESLVVAALVIVLALVGFALVRNRWRWVIPVVAAALVVGAFLPAPRPVYDGRVVGEAMGDARVPLRLFEGASVTVTGGRGEIVGEDARITCAATCAYAVEHARLGARPGAGNATIADVDVICFTSPPTLLLVGGIRCVTCSTMRSVMREGSVGPDPDAPPSAVC